MRHRRKNAPFALGLLLLCLAGCDTGTDQPGGPASFGSFELTGFVSNPVLDEISGIEAAGKDRFFVHNDEGKALLYVIDSIGLYQSTIELEGAKNRDWEDLTIVDRADRRWIVAADIGDNDARFNSVRLYFAAEPQVNADGEYPKKLEVSHELKVRYPDGPRDCEALAYDAGSDQILFLTKRDKPPRLYALDAVTALNQPSAELEFLAEVPTISPPSAAEMLRGGKKALWLSQPTGMDISADGALAAVLTYRSLNLYTREATETWAEAFQRAPREILGPPGIYDEAVSFDANEDAVYVTTEKIPTPLYRLKLPLLEAATRAN